jgi:hypothetical protein
MKYAQLLTVIVGVMSTGAVFAQPASSPAVSPHLQLDDDKLITQGEIGDGTRWGGIVTASVLGFGAGQAVEGRWHDTGWIFTIGESASAGVVIGGFAAALSQCPLYFQSQDTTGCKVADGVAIGGLIAWGALRVAGIVDASMGPSIHNRHVREARQRLARSGRAGQMTPYFAPTSQGEIAGLAGSF